MSAPKVERDFHEAVDLCELVDVILEPSRKDGGRIGALVFQGAHAFKRAGDGVLDRRPEQIRLAVEIVIDERRIDAEGLGDVLDRHRGEVALGKKIEGSGKEFVDAAGAVFFAPGASTDFGFRIPGCRASSARNPCLAVAPYSLFSTLSAGGRKRERRLRTHGPNYFNSLLP